MKQRTWIKAVSEEPVLIADYILPVHIGIPLTLDDQYPGPGNSSAANGVWVIDDIAFKLSVTERAEQTLDLTIYATRRRQS